MSSVIAACGGRYAFLAADTRMNVPGVREETDDATRDVGFRGIDTPAGPKALAHPDRRKIGPTPGPGWVAGTGTGGALLQFRLALNSLAAYGTSDLEVAVKVLEGVPERSAELLREWGWSDEAAEAQRAATLLLGMIRPSSRGPEMCTVGTNVEPSTGRTAGIWAPDPLGREECDQMMQEHLIPVGRLPGEHPAELLLAVARAQLGLADMAYSVSRICQVGILFMPSPTVVRTAQLNFDADELLEEYSAAELTRELRQVLSARGAPDRAEWDPEPVWLTERPEPVVV